MLKDGSSFTVLTGPGLRIDFGFIPSIIVFDLFYSCPINIISLLQELA